MKHNFPLYTVVSFILTIILAIITSAIGETFVGIIIGIFTVITLLATIGLLASTLWFAFVDKVREKDL